MNIEKKVLGREKDLKRMKLHLKEIENVSKLEPLERYQYFIRKIADFEEFWTLVDQSGDVALSEVEENTLISFWSAEDFIKSNLFDNWKNLTAFKLTLDDFENTFAPLILDNNYLINVFPVNRKSGFVVDVDEFIRDLNEELEQYQ